MTDKSAFSETEWGLLVRLPRWVVEAASVAQPDRAGRTHAEREAGFVAVAVGRESNSRLVAEIARTTMATFDDPDQAGSEAPDFSDAQHGLTGVIDRTEAAMKVLSTKADGADTDAYRSWVLSVCDEVLGESSSRSMLGIGRSTSHAERGFRDGLTRALHS